MRGILSYYPFGMIMPTRSYSSSDYRYGFNGQEKDAEINGDGNSYSFEYRILDSRLGRFMSVDPLRDKYPMLTPYQFAANQPIHAVDLEGLENLNDLNPTDQSYDGPGMSDDGNGSFESDGTGPQTNHQGPGLSFVSDFWAKQWNYLMGNSDNKKTMDFLLKKLVGATVLVTNDPRVIWPNASEGELAENMETYPGVAVMISPTDFVIYFNPEYDDKPNGVSPLFEEICHVVDYYTGACAMKPGTGGSYVPVSKEEFIAEEGRAKFFVANNFLIFDKYNQTIEKYPNCWAEVITEFSHYKKAGMTAEEISKYLITEPTKTDIRDYLIRCTGTDRYSQDIPYQASYKGMGSYRIVYENWK